METQVETSGESVDLNEEKRREEAEQREAEEAADREKEGDPEKELALKLASLDFKDYVSQIDSKTGELKTVLGEEDYKLFFSSSTSIKDITLPHFSEELETMKTELLSNPDMIADTSFMLFIMLRMAAANVENDGNKEAAERFREAAKAYAPEGATEANESREYQMRLADMFVETLAADLIKTSKTPPEMREEDMFGLGTKIRVLLIQLATDSFGANSWYSKVDEEGREILAKHYGIIEDDSGGARLYFFGTPQDPEFEPEYLEVEEEEVEPAPEVKAPVKKNVDDMSMPSLEDHFDTVSRLNDSAKNALDSLKSMLSAGDWEKLKGLDLAAAEFAEDNKNEVYYVEHYLNGALKAAKRQDKDLAAHLEDALMEFRLGESEQS